MILCMMLFGTSVCGNLTSVYANENTPVEQTEENTLTEEVPSESTQTEGEMTTDVETPVAETETPVVSEEPTAQAEAVYTLHITHYFRFTADGESRHVTSEETVSLKTSDFSDGMCDINRFAYQESQLTVSEAKPVALDSFDANKEGGARIVYQLSDGWQMTTHAETTKGNTTLRSVFDGQLSDYSFEAANVVRVSMKYIYSRFGSLKGMQASAPQTLDMLAEKNADGNYEFKIDIPNRDQFRLILSAAPLNKFLVTQVTGNETDEEMSQIMEQGGFNADIRNNCIYYYQQVTGDLLATPNYSLTNPKYSNRYSDEYNEAWNAARLYTVEGADGFTAMVVCGREHASSEADHGANAVVNPKVKIVLTEEQLQNAMENGIDLTAIYRRSVTFYTTNHWVPVTLCGMTEDEIAASGKPTKIGDDGVNYVRLDSEYRQGRTGSNTAAQRKAGGVYDLLDPKPFSQEIIQNAAISSATTVIDIYYEPSDAYAVIFDTDWEYIPRQRVRLGDQVEFIDKANHPSRKGYEFGGWRYLKEGATPNANNEYDDDDYIPVAKVGDTFELQITPELISQKALMKETVGIQALRLYPIWIPDQTQITVVLWTEDLTLIDDIQAYVSEGSDPYYDQLFADYQDAPVSHKAINADGSITPLYSNSSDFSMQVTTGVELLREDGTLLPEVQEKVTDTFSNLQRAGSSVDVSQFFTQDCVQVVHETESGIDNKTVTANADGRTVVNVYFTRNIYTLKFHYYGQSESGNVRVAAGTNGYTYGGTERILDADGNLNFWYYGGFNDGTNGWSNNFVEVPSETAQNMPVPKEITIHAKFDADLRNIWPVSQSDQYFMLNEYQKVSLISWAATDGIYRDEALDPHSNHYYEGTVMGLFATMDEYVIADPTKPELVHHLVAYWEQNYAPSRYRYTHCFEAPQLDVTSEGVITVNLYTDPNNPDSANALENTLYLVPRDNEAFVKFGFTDFLPVAYENGNITYGDAHGAYYAVRGYKLDDGTIHYYAVGRQVETVSTNSIEMQNPSARARMERANAIADHTTKYRDEDGRPWGGSGITIGTDEPYDLYFYYDRDRFSLRYVVPNTDPEDPTTMNVLGEIELPFGAHITPEYGFKLDYRDTNQTLKEDGTPKYLWSYPEGAAEPVCPERNVNGTLEWKFKGWGLGPSGANMLWEFKEPDPMEPQEQIDEDFYIASDVLIYAIWDRPECEVTFHFNGGVLGSKDSNSLGVIVPANDKITDTEASIPRPFREGYSLAGWYLADETGAFIEPKTEFNFDDLIIEDMHVAADWSAVRTDLYNYNIYYVAKTLREEDKDTYQQTIKIKTVDNESMIAEDGEEYYVMKEEQIRDKVHTTGIRLNFTVKAYEGYIPVNTNAYIELDAPDHVYNAFFFYDTYTNNSHRVAFIEAGTETSDSPTIIDEMVIKTDKSIVTPDVKTVQKLIGDGYELVNKEGNAYTTVETYADLTWLDETGAVQDTLVFHGADIPETVTFLVQPINYTINYRNADGSPAAADEALEAILADSNTSIEDALAQSKNPMHYTIKDSFTLVNPDMIYNTEDAKWYEFAGWSLGEQTTQRAANGILYQPLTVDAGTKGNLNLVANWTVSTEYGDLTVTNTITGEGADPNQEFTFTVTLDHAINGVYGGMEFTDGEATFVLKGGESLTAEGLATGVKYAVTQTEKEHFKMTSTGAEGTIETGTEAIAAFTNAYEAPVGDLTVTNTISGEGADTEQEFNFTVTLNDDTINGIYGGMEFTNGKATFVLKGGESLTAESLPAGIKYTVTQTEVDHYKMTSTDAEGTIEEKAEATAAFTNAYEAPVGDLTVTNMISGKDADIHQTFTFTVTLDDDTINGVYGGMEFTNGKATFVMKGGEGLTAVGLPVGIKYTVTQTKQDGYKMTSVGYEGTISDGIEQVAAFHNEHQPKHTGVNTSDSTNTDFWQYMLMISGLGMLLMMRKSYKERYTA